MMLPTQDFTHVPAVPVRRHRRTIIIMFVLVVIAATLAGILIAQTLRSDRRAERNAGAALTAIDAAAQACEQVRALGGVCTVRPSALPQPAVAGATGARGPAGLIGPPGPAPACLSTPGQCRGRQGPPGPAGSPGPAPPCLATASRCQGAAGNDGKDGKDGESIVGPAGKDGTDGQPGKDGADGAPGPACPDGYGLRPVTLETIEYLLCARLDSEVQPSPSPL